LTNDTYKLLESKAIYSYSAAVIRNAACDHQGNMRTNVGKDSTQRTFLIKSNHTNTPKLAIPHHHHHHVHITSTLSSALQASRPPLRMRPHQRIYRNTHAPRKDIRVGETLAHHYPYASHNAAVAVTPAGINIPIPKAASLNTLVRPGGPKVNLQSRLTIGHSLWRDIRRSTCSVAAGWVDVAGYDTHVLGDCGLV
jgi:hypothetical protein